MVDPIKISEAGRALTCDEYDDNLDILQDRANHVGTQVCATISDFDACVAAAPAIVALDDDITTIEDRLDQIEDDISASGTIAGDIADLEAALRAAIDANTAEINAINSEIDNDLIPDIAANAAGLVAVTNTVTANYNDLNPRVLNVEGRITTAEADISANSGLISTINTVTVPGLQADISSGDSAVALQVTNEANIRASEVIRLEGLITDEENDRIAGDNNLANNLTPLITANQQAINNEAGTRLAEDTTINDRIDDLELIVNAIIPTGTITAWAGNALTPPTGWLPCVGYEVSKTTYAALYAVIGDRYGTPPSDPVNNFLLPNLVDKYMQQSGNLNLDGLTNQYVGDNNKVLNVNQMPLHTHDFFIGGHNHDVDIEHWHVVEPRSHTHGINNLPVHQHSLAPYRNVDLDGGDEDGGGELTSIPSSEPGIFNPNTGFNAVVAGPAVVGANIQIYPSDQNFSDYNLNRTNGVAVAGGVLPSNNAKTTGLNSDATNIQPTGSAGLNQAIDFRSAFMQINYIIKT